MAQLSSLDMISTVKQIADLPRNAYQTDFSNAVLLQLLTEELRNKVVPFVVSLRENFYQCYVEENIVSGQSIYEISPRTVGSVLRELKAVTSNGNLVPLSQIDLEDANFPTNNAVYSNCLYFYTDGNNIVLYPTPSNTNLIKLRQYIFPMVGDFKEYATLSGTQLVQYDVKIVSIGTNTLGLSLVNGYGSPTLNITGKKLDIMGSASPYAFKGLDFAVSGSPTLNTGTTVVTLDKAIPSNVKVGDLVTISGENYKAQMPYELREMLASYVVIRIYEQLEAWDKVKALNEKIMQMKQDMGYLLKQRVQGAPKKARTRLV